ncbi:hypothetical protein HRG_002773 [Hirsutella rhossiliensis]|uniref:Uncharacterized protein n=1 Tax=Hirsutella rhossiliensis TaxID=111463 RepID=A0A9P8N0P5_9HYPO|nr:uncharacterized protein HRG_02773 [Hirsutella rhossiliensis]KAH0964757.1 hypothetical protein HRG_02773 [Hirsutella rhossiliensis]
MAEDNNNMQSDVLSALVAEIRSLREESSRRNTQFEERFIALELQQHQQARSSELLEPTPSVTPAVPIEDTRRPKLRDIPKFGGDKAQWRSWKLETEGKLRQLRWAGEEMRFAEQPDGTVGSVEKALRQHKEPGRPETVRPETEVRREDMMEWEPTLQASAKVNAARTRSDKNTYGHQSNRPEDQALLARAKWVDQTEMDACYREGRCLRCGRDNCRIERAHWLRLSDPQTRPVALRSMPWLRHDQRSLMPRSPKTKLRLIAMKIQTRDTRRLGDGKEVKIDKITYVSIDLDGHQQHRVFAYVIDDLNWDMILGKRWMEDQDVHIHAKEGYLEIGSSGVQARDRRRYQPPS